MIQRSQSRPLLSISKLSAVKRQLFRGLLLCPLQFALCFLCNIGVRISQGNSQGTLRCLIRLEHESLHRGFHPGALWEFVSHFQKCQKMVNDCQWDAKIWQCLKQRMTWPQHNPIDNNKKVIRRVAFYFLPLVFKCWQPNCYPQHSVCQCKY